MLSILGRLFGSWQNLLIGIPITLIALTGHELAHGYVSTKLGDPTPRMQGRLTFNPLAHLDIVGTVLMVLTGFGWAKPVQVDARYYKNPKLGMAITAAAGPLANLVMAFAGLFIYVLVLIFDLKFGFLPLKALSVIESIAYLFAFRNLCFMVFNLIPIPPLDGSKVLGIILPNRIYYTMLQYERYAIIIIMLLALSGAFDFIIGGGANAICIGMFNILARLASFFM